MTLRWRQWTKHNRCILWWSSAKTVGGFRLAVWPRGGQKLISLACATYRAGNWLHHICTQMSNVDGFQLTITKHLCWSYFVVHSKLGMYRFQFSKSAHSRIWPDFHPQMRLKPRLDYFTYVDICWWKACRLHTEILMVMKEIFAYISQKTGWICSHTAVVSEGSI